MSDFFDALQKAVTNVNRELNISLKMATPDFEALVADWGPDLTEIYEQVQRGDIPKKRARWLLEHAIYDDAKRFGNYTKTHTVAQPPYTMVQLDLDLAGDNYVAWGFAKVSWPDKHDYEFGRDLCIRRAARRLARLLLVVV